jgi:hypothetical protein
MVRITWPQYSLVLFFIVPSKLPPVFYSHAIWQFCNHFTFLVVCLFGGFQLSWKMWLSVLLDWSLLVSYKSPTCFCSIHFSHATICCQCQFWLLNEAQGQYLNLMSTVTSFMLSLQMYSVLGECVNIGECKPVDFRPPLIGVQLLCLVPIDKFCNIYNFSCSLMLFVCCLTSSCS